MTALKAHEVGRYLKRPDLTDRLIVAYGTDGGRVHETAQAVIDAYAAAGPAEVLTFDAAELDADPQRLAVEVRTISLFGERRIVRVRGNGRTLSAMLNDVLAEPGDAVIVVEAGNLAPRDGLRQVAETARNAKALPCYPDSDETLAALLRDAFAEAGIAAEPDVVPTLVQNLGNDREITRRELDKLLLYAAETRTLTRADVLLLCTDNAATAVDDVADAAGTGHAERLEVALSRALSNGADPQYLLIAALRHFAGLRRLRAAVDGGRSIDTVIETMRPKPHFSRKAVLTQQLRLWTDGALAAACARLNSATAEGRRLPHLGETVMRRALLALCDMAARA